MAERKRIRKSSQSVRERTEKAESTVKKPRRLRRTASSLARPLRTARQFGAKEYYLPMPDNRIGRLLNKRRSLMPRYFRESWQELKQVQWPSRKETWKLTLAVFTFAIFFAILISITDYGLDKIFQKTFLR